MQQSRASNQGGYRIKKQRNNFLPDGNSKDQEDNFKMSIHSSTNKSPGRGSGNKKRNNSLANRHNDSEKFSYRSRNSNVTKGNLSSSSLSGSNKKKDGETGQIKQFANVKQLLMIKAYDKKLFRKVTGSNQANKNFLRLGDVRNDPFRKETFKVMIQNFKQITIRIRKGYEKVLSKILFQNTNISAIVTLANVQPLLEKVRQQADLMHYKVKECLEAHDSREFRSLLIKFQTFLTASEEIEEIILIVSESKNRIDDLFKNLERDNHLDEKVNHERRKGLKKVRNAVRDYGDDGVEAKILDKVQMAINQMADKNLEAYSKINGARGLMMRIKQCLKQNKDFYSLEDIVRLNKIFKEVLVEAESYERFTQKFMEEGDILNDDLRKCIIKYRQEVEVNKASVYAMELKFVSNIIETSIQTFEANYSVCNVVDSTLCQDFQKVTNLLESVCGCISDETAKVNIKAMSRDVGHQFKNVEKLIKKLQRTPKSIALDTLAGLQNLEKIQGLINEYKKSVMQIMERQDRAHRQITRKRVNRQNIDETDLEQNSIAEMIRVSKKLNNDERKQRINKWKAFQNVKQNASIPQLAAQIGDSKFYVEFKELHAEIQEVCHNNQLSSLIQDVTTQNNMYDLSPLFVELHQIASSVSQYSLLKSLQNLKSKGFSRLKQVSMVQCFIQRVYAVVALKGLDKKTIKKIDDNRLIQFPENQHDVESLKRDVKYLKTVCGMMPEVLVEQKLNRAYIVMEQLIEGIKITQDLKWNKDGLCYIQNSLIFKNIAEAFQRVFRFKQIVETDELLKKLKVIGQNLDKMMKREKNSGFNQTRTEKVLEIIQKYERINSRMIENMQKIEKMQGLEGYSQLVFCCCQYLKSTVQSFHATLNKTNHVLWICQESKQNSKSLFGNSIGLTQLKAGQISKTYNQKSGIKARKQIPKPKVQQKEKEKQKKKKPKDDDEMGEQIDEIEQVDEVEDGIDDDIQDEQMEEDMQQEMEENMDEMEEEMQDEIPNEEQMDEQMIIEADENIIDDFESETVMKKNNSRPSAAKNKDYTLTTTNKPETTLNNSNPAKTSIEPSHKKEESQIIIIKEKKATVVLQIFKYIETLEELAEILKKIANLRLNFWQAADLKTVEAYFNKQGKTEIQKLLVQQLQKFCKAQFPVEFIPSIKDSQTHKNILKQIDELSLLKFAVLSDLLAFAGKNYGCLMGINKELLRLSIQDNDKWQPSNSVEAYIKKQLVLSGIKEQNFEKENYIEQLIKTKKGKEVRYEFGDRNMQLKGEELKEKVAQCQKIIKSYEEYSKFPDGVNLHNLILSMWFNCIKQQNQLVEITVPQKFHQDLKGLTLMQNFAHAIYYIKNLRDEAKNIMESMQKHKKKLAKIFKHLNKDTLLSSIAELTKIYACQPAKIIYFEEHPVMYTQTSVQTEQKYKIIKHILSPESSSTNKVNSEQMRNKIKKNAEHYAEFGPETNRILSLLQIECHIWASPSVLHVVENRDEILKIIINYISNGLVKDPHEELENIQEINNCLKTINKQHLIFEYAIKEDKKIMNPSLNAQFYREFLKVLGQHNKKVQTKIQVSDTIFQNLFGFEDTEDSATTQVFDYTETLSLILKEKLFVQKWETIFNSHIPTQNKIEELKKKIDSQVRLLLAIVEDPIEVEEAAPEKSLEEINKKNDLAAKWYKEHRSKDKNTLFGLEVCPCSGSCEKQYTLYVGQAKNRLDDYMRKLSNSSLFSNYLKKNQKKSSKAEWKQSTTIHLGKATREICTTLVETDLDAFGEFIHQYNFVHIIRKETNNKSLVEIYQKLVNLNGKKLDTALMLNQLLIKIKQSGSFYKLLVGIIHKNCGVELSQLIKNNEEEKAKLADIAVGKTEYTKFGNWVVHIAGKIYKLPFYILVDIENRNDVVCIMIGKTDLQVKKELQNLQLPTEFTVFEQKNTYKKIHLNEQYFTVQLDKNELTKQDLFDLHEENFGIKEVEREDKQKETWLLGVYRKSHVDTEQDQYQLMMTTLTEKLIQESKKVQVNINQFETKADIELRILQISFIEGGAINSNNIIREIKSEIHKGISLNQDIVATALSRFLKKQIISIKEKKRAELQEKLRREQRQKEAEEERIRAAEKAKQEQELKRKEEEELKRKQEQQAKFVLQNPNQTSVIREEANVYLDKLYEQLGSKQVYRASKQKLKNQKQNKESLEKPKSSKNIEIKTETEKAIQKVELTLEEDAKSQFHKIAENYLNCVVEFICYRDKILEQVLQRAKSPEPIKSEEMINEIEYLDNLMDEISTLQGYQPELRAKITQILKTLSKQKEQVLTSIYMMPS